MKNSSFGHHDYHELLNNIYEVDKQQLYHFVKDNCNHGAKPTSNQLESMLQALRKRDEKTFIESIIDITSESALKDIDVFRLPGTEHFYTINAFHARHDPFGETINPSLKGKTVTSAFNGKLLAKN